MIDAQTLRQEIEATAEALGLSPSTIGERAGQGGQFYRRLCDGKRVWPDTAATVLERLKQMRSPTSAPSSEAL